MKKCKECGAIQSNGRVCRDCGARLGKPMSAAEEAELSKDLSQKIDDMVEKSDDFYVPIYDKIMGALCIVAVIAAIVLVVLAGKDASVINNQLPDNVRVLVQNSSSDVAKKYSELLARMDVLENIIRYSLSSIVALAIACPMLLAPKFMWFLDTLKYRIFYEWDTTPSPVAIILRKAVTYILFAVGIIGIVYGYFLCFSS